MDWTAVRQFYVETRSLKAAAEKFGVSFEALKKRAQRQRWRDTEGTSPNSEGTNVPSTNGAKGTFSNGQGTSNDENVPSMSPDRSK